MEELKIPENCKLVIFDLDNTLHIESKPGQKLTMTVREIIAYFYVNNIKIALASLNKYAENSLELYHITDYFNCVTRRKNIWECTTLEEYRLSKTRAKTYMLNEILEKLQIEPSEAILFDDRMRHIYEALKLGMKFSRVNPKRLLDWSNVKDGFKKFSLKRRYTIY